MSRRQFFLSQGVAFQAQLLLLSCQKLRLLCSVGGVTYLAAFLQGLVPVGLVKRCLVMTAKAQILPCLFEHRWTVRRMRIMTGRAFLLPDRLMHRDFRGLSRHFRMAAVTEPGPPFVPHLQGPDIPMRLVAQMAIHIPDRLMDPGFLQIALDLGLMTFRTPAAGKPSPLPLRLNAG